MSNPELFKYDVRIRERMLKSKLLSEEQVRAHLDALTDVAERCEDVVAQQPALARHDVERAEPARRPVLFGVPIPMSPRATTQEPKASEPKGAEVSEDASIAVATGAAGVDEDEDEDDDDEDDDDEDDDDEDDEDDEDEGVKDGDAKDEKDVGSES